MCGVIYILGGLGAGFYCLWTGIHGLMRGVAVDTGRHHTTSYARATAPLEYWLTEIGLLALGIILVALFGGALFQRVRLARVAKTTMRDVTGAPKPP